MVKATLTPMQFEAKSQELKQQGITLNGTAGVAVKDGISIGYHYEQGELYAAVIKHPFLEPTHAIESKLCEWIGGEIIKPSQDDLDKMEDAFKGAEVIKQL